MNNTPTISEITDAYDKARELYGYLLQHNYPVEIVEIIMDWYPKAESYIDLPIDQFLHAANTLVTRLNAEVERQQQIARLWEKRALKSYKAVNKVFLAIEPVIDVEFLKKQIPSLSDAPIA